LRDPNTGLGLDGSDIGFAGAICVAGACIGALFFGQLTDRFGRKKLFILTLLVYLVGTVATAFSMNPTFYFGRCGGRLSPHGAAAQPRPGGPRARLAGRSRSVRCWVSASCWYAATFPKAPAGCSSTAARTRARRSFGTSRGTVEHDTGATLPGVSETITIRQRKTISLPMIARTVFTMYPRRTILCLSLFIGQAFLYNAFFFTYGDALGELLGVELVGYYIALFALSNFAGALLLGPLFDTVGRVRISGTSWRCSSASTPSSKRWRTSPGR